MPTCTILEAAERSALVHVLRSHPEWTLADLTTLIDANTGTRAPVLRTLTIGELDGRFPTSFNTNIDHRRLALAKRMQGHDFDLCVAEVVEEADGRAVGAAYLRERVGGPRWKLHAALTRLVDVGLLTRTGTTSGTRYRLSAG